MINPIFQPETQNKLNEFEEKYSYFFIQTHYKVVKNRTLEIWMRICFLYYQLRIFNIFFQLHYHSDAVECITRLNDYQDLLCRCYDESVLEDLQNSITIFDIWYQISEKELQNIHLINYQKTRDVYIALESYLQNIKGSILSSSNSSQDNLFFNE